MTRTWCGRIPRLFFFSSFATLIIVMFLRCWRMGGSPVANFRETSVLDQVSSTRFGFYGGTFLLYGFFFFLICSKFT